MKDHKHMKELIILLVVSLLFGIVILVKVSIENKVLVPEKKEVNKREIEIEVPAGNVKTLTEIEEERTIIEEQEVKEVIPTFHTAYTSTDLNIRTESNANSNIYTSVKANTELQVFDNFDENGWKKIKYDDREFYVNGKYLSDKPVEVKKKPVKKQVFHLKSNQESTQKSSANLSDSSNNLIGKFKITHYAEHNITSTGTTPCVGRTIAVDPNVIPYGSRVVINGHTYIAEDCGGAIKGNVIDIFVGSTKEAYQKGVYYTNVYWG